jgi:hypothetical protein
MFAKKQVYQMRRLLINKGTTFKCKPAYFSINQMIQHIWWWTYYTDSCSTHSVQQKLLHFVNMAPMVMQLSNLSYA